MVLVWVGLFIVVALLWLATIFLKIVNAPCYARDIDWIFLLSPILVPFVLLILFGIGGVFIVGLFTFIAK